MRLIEEQSFLSSSDGLAGDEAMAIGVSGNDSLATIRLYRYKPCVIVGRYQNLTDAINLDACREHGLEWNRRHSGGGTVMMGPDQVAAALVLPDKKGKFIGSIREHFHFFAGIFSEALNKFGIQSEFMGKNDLCVDGKKIAGLAISQDLDGVIFFHASLLLDFDIELMVKVLNLPTDILNDRGQSCFSERMTTVKEHNPNVTFDEMKDSIVKSLENTMKVKVDNSTWSEYERDTIQKLKNEKYENDEWIYSTRVMRRWKGTAERKTPGGTLRVYIDGSGSVLDAVLITGDYFCRNVDLAILESSLKGTPTRYDDILKVINNQECEKIYQVNGETLTEIILTAVNNKKK